MIYEIIGKIAITLGILFLIPTIWIIGAIFLDWLSDQIKKLPETLRTITALSLLVLCIVGLGVIIYKVL